MVRYLVYCIFLLFFVINFKCNAGIKIVVLDENSKLIYDAYLCSNGFVLSNTDIEGKCELLNKNSDTLVVHYLGYKNYPIVLSDLKENDSLVVRLSIEPIELSEIEVKIPDYKKILKAAMINFHNAYPENQWLCYGNYTRATVQNNKYVDFSQYVGFSTFLGSKKTKDYVVDQWNFLPEQSRCSQFFQNNSVYSFLEPAYSTNYSFNANWKNLTGHYSNVERFGPQNISMFKYYVYKLSSYNDTLIVLNFQVNKKYLQKKLKMDGRGKIYINRKDNQFYKIEFEQLLINYNDKVSYVEKSPPSYITSLKVNYCLKGERIYPKEVQYNRRWILDHGRNRVSTAFIPRLKAAKTQLSEFEFFKVQQVHVQSIDEKEIIKNLSRKISLMSFNEKIVYIPSFWTGISLPDKLDSAKVFSDLSQITPIEEQFNLQNGKFRLDSQYLDLYIRPEYHTEYYNYWDSISKTIEKLKLLHYEIVY